MAWVIRPSVAPQNDPDVPLLGVDLNSSRARAVQGAVGMLPRALPLDGAQEELPLYLSLQNRQLQVGQAGYALCRRSPHLVCLDFLSALGQQRVWKGGRHRIDAARAVSVVLERIRAACSRTRGMLVAVPPYLHYGQAVLLKPLIEKAHITYLGWIKSPLACALSAHATTPWTGPALFVDIDEHALSASLVLADGEQAWIQVSQSWPDWNLRTWKVRLLDRIAERCVLQSRRDPRDSALAEQALYEQLDEALETSGQGKLVELLIQTAHWYHHLLLQPDEVVRFGERMVKQVVENIRVLLSGAAWSSVHAIFVTRAAARLPGLVLALHHLAGSEVPQGQVEASGEDFGEDLVEAPNETALVTVLPDDAVALATHELALRIYQAQVAPGPYDLSVPLPRSATGANPAPANKRTFRILSADS